MSTVIVLSSNKLTSGTCIPGTMQELLDLVKDNLDAELPDSVTLFNYGPNTPPVDRQDQPWIRTTGTGLLLGIYTFTGGKWEPADPPFTTGDIMMFSGPESLILPPWYLCNGQQIQSIQNNQVTNTITLPDLRGRFIVGTGQRVLPTGSEDTSTNFELGDKGGEEDHSLTEDENGPHSHGTGQAGAQFVVKQTGFGGELSGSGEHFQIATTAPSGTGAAHNNLPPYYALAFKMYISREDAGLT